MDIGNKINDKNQLILYSSNKNLTNMILNATHNSFKKYEKLYNKFK